MGAMGVRGTAVIAVLGLALATGALADEAAAPGSAPPAGAAAPPSSPTPPPPSPAPPVYRAPPCPRPCEAPPVEQFDHTVRAVTQRSSVMPSQCITSCRPPCRPGPAKCPGYAGILPQAYPGLGFGVEFGMWFCRTPVADLAWEVNLNYQDLTDGFNNIRTGESGKWMGARVGIKASFCPRGSSHPTLRAGLAWNIATGDVANDYDLGDIPDTPFAVNYFGGYLGIGWEWDLFGGFVTTGPEIWGFAGPFADRVQGDDGAYTATVAWHVVLNF